MIDDFRTLPDDVALEVDLCIVGAGAAGIAIAREFLDSSTRVLLVESGGAEPHPATDQLNHGETIGVRNEGLAAGRARALGGATKLWAGQCMPLDAIDFETRPWVPYSGWPISKAEVDAFYPRAELLMGVSDQPYDAQVWRNFGITPPALDDACLGCKCSVYSPHPDLGATFHGVLRRSDNVRVLLHATAGRLHLDDRSAVRRLELAAESGKRGQVSARAFVLCGGGIENARLLLLSDHQERDGVGNAHGLVGRFFQEHPNGFTASVETAAPLKLQDPYSLLYRGRHRYFPKIPLSAARQRSEQVLNGIANLVYEFDDRSGVNAVRGLYGGIRARRFPSDTGRLLLEITRSLGPVLALAKRRYVQGRSTGAPPQRIWLLTQTEQAPNPASRVTLSEQRDALGQRLARLDWQLTELDRRTAETVARTVKAEFARLGLGDVRIADWVTSDRWTDHISDSYHHIGTTRMAGSPREGVVDAHCQVHGVNGLYIAGSSVFPTSGYANPTLTIVALALRLADHLKRTALRAG